MYSIKNDAAKNRLYVTIGVLKTRDSCNLVNAMLKRASKMRRGFTLLLDLSTFKPTSELATQHICTGIDYLQKQGLGYIAKVSCPMEAMADIDVFCIPYGMECQTAATAAEADKILDWWAAAQEAKGAMIEKGAAPAFQEYNPPDCVFLSPQD
ncbi:hypothetical protein [Desulfatibacillum aliphaticivorans]|uniref:STAS domain-containing protein n=1 Tax=Desulfatibacillum aliphaticivorans TaxID=218208 RepID=B8F903_DESAL|nr:hypothetical protein [Desulfatibacillum aliphaticivorans]ACL02035.1 hypothetical protein Dalk_0326 [Desulfatibacillum aliphaticivorans]